MRIVVQRVSRARVTVEEKTTGEIAAGLVILLGVGKEDSPATAVAMAEKVANLRIFEDEAGKMEPVTAGCEGFGAGGLAVHVIRGCAGTATPQLCLCGASRSGEEVV